MALAYLLLALILLINLGLLAGTVLRSHKLNVAQVALGEGTSLEDIVVSLERAAKLAATVANELEINIAEARQQFSRLVILLDRLQMDVTATGEADAVVASNLDALQQQAREMEQTVSPPGTVADTAAGGHLPRARKTKKT